jgi:hypothetical protein
VAKQLARCRVDVRGCAMQAYKWISFEVQLKSPEPTNHELPSAHLDRQQEPAATAPSSVDRDHPASAS